MPDLKLDLRITGAPLGSLLGGTILTPVNPLTTPPNLYSASISAFDSEDGINTRSNWEVSGGKLTCLNLSNNDVRFATQDPLISGHAHVMTWHVTPGVEGSVRVQLAGDGSAVSSNFPSDSGGVQLAYFTSSEVAGNYTRSGLKPAAPYDGVIDDVALYDLASVDPNIVACDILLCVGDGNMSNSTSDLVDHLNLETPYDPRVWYMPCLRTSSTYSPTRSERHIVQPLIEPVQNSKGAANMSPIAAITSQVVGYSADRGRPIVVMALADPGSGLSGTEDWDKSSTVPTTGARMYNEMLAMKAAIDAMAPAHQFIGVAVSLGVEDLSGVDYDTTWEPKATAFVSNIRSDFGVPDLPIVWAGLNPDYEAGDPPDYDVNGNTPYRAGRMRTSQARLDQNSGSPIAQNNLTFVPSVSGQSLGNPTPDVNGYVKEPHFTAAGMQANGRALGAALNALLS